MPEPCIFLKLLNPTDELPKLEFSYLTLCMVDFPIQIRKKNGLSIIYETVHEISNNVVCAISKASDQHAHMRSLIRAFASRLSIILLLSY